MQRPGKHNNLIGATWKPPIMFNLTNTYWRIGERLADYGFTGTRKFWTNARFKKTDLLYKFRRISFEPLLAFQAAEIMRFSSIIDLEFGCLFIQYHAAYGISRHRFTLHNDGHILIGYLPIMVSGSARAKDTNLNMQRCRIETFTIQLVVFSHGYEWGLGYYPFFALVDVDTDKTLDSILVIREC